jgi:hypothetical protein
MKPRLLSAVAGLALAALGSVAHAQTPTTPAPGTPPTGAPAPAPVPAVSDDYLLGRSYRVETLQGTTFTGTVVSISLANVEFDVPEMGKVTLERSQIRRADLQAPATAGVNAGYFDIGNGSRLFFAPTGRGLRRGENTLQSVNLFVVGANFGINDYFSMGGYVSLVPGVSLDQQFLALTPKLSYPINDKLHVGAGLLYIRAPDFDSNDGGIGLGIGYGALTVGGADNNFTVGLGYGFAEGEIGSTPVIQVGGQTRVSRRISLISENYLFADKQAGLGGLYGVKINWNRVSLGLGAMYAYTFEYEDRYYGGGGSYTRGGEGFTTYILPVYYDVTFRFGKTK